jgi:hypothetical protein
MACVTLTPQPGPDLTLVRGATMPVTFKAYRLTNGAAYPLIADDITVELVISNRTGMTAPVILTYSSTDSSQIAIAPADDGTFTVLFDDSMFADLPNKQYFYAIWGYLDGEPFPIALPAKVNIVESIGPTTP